MFNIYEVINKESKKEMIDELFNQVYSVKSEVLRDTTAQLEDAKKELAKQGFDADYIKNYKLAVSREKITGFYIHLPFIANEKMDNLHTFFRMFYTAEKESKKIMLGDTNALDIENTLQDARLYICECLHKLLDSKLNDKLENDLKINNLNDFRIILLDSSLSRKLSNYIITYVKFSILNIARSDSNPDFECLWDNYQKKWIFRKINKLYLDKPEADNSARDNYAKVKDKKNKDQIELIAQEYEENNSTTFIQYVVSNYIQKGALTTKQYEFWNDALRLELDSKELKEIYTKQQIHQFKKQILKRLETKLENDSNVHFVEGIKTYKLIKTKLFDENGLNIFKKIEIQNEGRYILLENYPTLRKTQEDIKSGEIA